MAVGLCICSILPQEEAALMMGKKAQVCESSSVSLGGLLLLFLF